VIEQIKHQLERLVQVRRVHDLTVEGPSIERELAMVKGEGQRRSSRRGAAACRRVSGAGDRCTTESFIFEITGRSDKIDQFVDLMLPLGSPRYRAPACGDPARRGGDVRLAFGGAAAGLYAAPQGS